MKRIILIISLIIMSIIALAAAKEGTGKGYGGDIVVSVEMDGDKITAIKVVKSNEDKRIGGGAIEKLTEAILRKQTTQVDNIAGATYTSTGFKEAVANASGK